MLSRSKASCAASVSPGFPSIPLEHCRLTAVLLSFSSVFSFAQFCFADRVILVNAGKQQSKHKVLFLFLYLLTLYLTKTKDFFFYSFMWIYIYIKSVLLENNRLCWKDIINKHLSRIIEGHSVSGFSSTSLLAADLWTASMICAAPVTHTHTPLYHQLPPPNKGIRVFLLNLKNNLNMYFFF